MSLDPLAVLASGNLLDELAQLPPEARANSPLAPRVAYLCDESAAPNTRHVYGRRWNVFLKWCQAHGLRALPADPEVVRVYLLGLGVERMSLATIEVSYAALSLAHRAAHVAPPASGRLRETLRALRRALGTRVLREAMELDTLRAIVRACAADLLAVRDRAIILSTYWGRLRRSETAALDCPVSREGPTLLLRVSDDDIRALAAHPEEALCPVRAIEAWIRQRGTCARPALAPSTGPLFVALHPAKGRRGAPLLFRTGQRIRGTDVDRALKRRVRLAGINAPWSSRDLRAVPVVEERDRGNAHGKTPARSAR